MMNNIFQELLHKGVLANYIDNFVIPARTMEELEEQTIRFLKIAEKHNLCFKRQMISHGRNPDLRGHSWKETGQNGARKELKQ